MQNVESAHGYSTVSTARNSIWFGSVGMVSAKAPSPRQDIACVVGKLDEQAQQTADRPDVDEDLGSRSRAGDVEGLLVGARRVEGESGAARLGNR